MTTDTPYAVVIDDESEMRGLHKLVLLQLGFEVILTSNAADGIEAVRQFDPEVTFLDVTMPGMDGFTAASRIREFSDTYLLMVSGHCDEIDVVQGLTAGADDYIFKPFRPRELRARVEAMLRRPRVRATTAEPAAPAPAPEPDVWRPAQRLTTAAEHETATVVVQAPRPTPPASGLFVRSGAEQAGLTASIPPAEVREVAPAGHRLHGRATHDRANGAVRIGPGSTALVPASPAVPDVEETRLAAVADAPAPQVAPQVAPQLTPVPDPGADDVLTRYGSLAIDPSRCVVEVDGEEVELTETEFALLAALAQSGTRVRSTANLVLALRGESYVTTYFVNEADKSAVKSHMASLVRRLGDTGTTPRWIESVRGVGYRMTAV